MIERFRRSERLESLGQLATGIAHDLNNMLGAMRGYAELLSAPDCEKENLRRYAEIIVQASERGADITRKLLSFSKRDERKMRLSEINKIVGEVVGLLERSVRRDIKVELRLSATRSSAYCDPSLLSNAILNLAVNARDAMPSGGSLVISTSNVRLDAPFRWCRPAEFRSGDFIKKYDIIDFDLGIKITGAGFPVYKGKGAKLQRALINFFLDEGEKAGYREIEPPIVVNEDSGFGTGQLPDKEGQMYHVGIDNLYMIPTAEVPITNIYRDVILDAADLPIKNMGYTPCFRREAGSWGAHVRGLNRLHQFDKVEIVQIAHPEKSYESLEEMVSHVESLLVKLELPYRIVRLCGGDMSFTSAMTYDFEVWSAAQQRWLEVSSTSNFEAFQANRLKCRFREKGAKQTTLCHTLNGSALALPRIVAALLENNQTPEGIRIPAVLVKYTGFGMIS
jgi:hypothetical protein